MRESLYMLSLPDEPVIGSLNGRGYPCSFQIVSGAAAQHSTNHSVTSMRHVCIYGAGARRAKFALMVVPCLVDGWPIYTVKCFLSEVLGQM
jgi:hypothetical protein